MVIQVDSREKAHAIQKILATFDDAGVKWFVSKLPVGDYMSLYNPRLVIDRKQNLNEICNNVVQDHKRFAAELVRAKEFGIHVIVLVEHGKNIRELNDVINWQNPRLKQSPMAVSGERLFRILSTMQNNHDKYDVEFRFCSKLETGKRIIEILSEGANNADQ
jgi:ERCC4-type nuclease